MPENKKGIAAQERVPSQPPALNSAVEEEGVAVMAEQCADLQGFKCGG